MLQSRFPQAPKFAQALPKILAVIDDLENAPPKTTPCTPCNPSTRTAFEEARYTLSGKSDHVDAEGMYVDGDGKPILLAANGMPLPTDTDGHQVYMDAYGTPAQLAD